MTMNEYIHIHDLEEELENAKEEIDRLNREITYQKSIIKKSRGTNIPAATAVPSGSISMVDIISSHAVSCPKTRAELITQVSELCSERDKLKYQLKCEEDRRIECVKEAHEDGYNEGYTLGFDEGFESAMY